MFARPGAQTIFRNLNISFSMEWISEHLIQVLIIVAAIIGSLLNKRRQDQDAEDSPESPYKQSEMDIEEMERTRRIQEEIRRKIAERRAGGAQSQQPAPQPTFRREPPPLREVIAERVERRIENPTTPRPSPSAAREAAMLERQRELAGRMEELERQRQAALKQRSRLQFPGEAAAKKATAPAQAARSAWLKELRDPASARRAIVLREILDRPVSLR